MIRILVPTDFSPIAYNAISYALRIYGNKSIHLVLLNAYHLSGNGAETFISIDDILLTNSENGLKNEVKKLKTEFPDIQFSVDLVSYFGSIKNGVKDCISKHDIDLVVMGSSAGSGLKKMILGSNSADLISEIKKPILIIPYKYSNHNIQNILLALDIKNPPEEELLDRVNQLAGICGAEIHFSWVHGEDLNHSISETFKESIKGQCQGIEVHFQALKGSDIFGELENYASSIKAELIAVIPQNHSLLEKMIHRSVSKEIALNSEIPILALQ